ncbi:short coiled-coil protein A isoform X2 [Heterodontus francisci]|uniref:short coiled-coil protein A isoform X2 n=1 Tax=Heterodontus francisci TaxID=7792 RepID=UPI00355C9897
MGPGFPGIEVHGGPLLEAFSPDVGGVAVKFSPSTQTELKPVQKIRYQVKAAVVRTLFSIRSNTGSDMDQAESTEEDGVFTTISLADDSVDSGSTVSDSKLDSELFMMNTEMEVIDPENQVELEEKTRLIKQVLELQHTLEELSARVDAVKEENLKLKSENQVLGQYIENLMSASSVFQTTDTKSKRK